MTTLYQLSYLHDVLNRPKYQLNDAKAALLFLSREAAVEYAARAFPDSSQPPEFGLEEVSAEALQKAVGNAVLYVPRDPGDQKLLGVAALSADTALTFAAGHPRTAEYMKWSDGKASAASVRQLGLANMLVVDAKDVVELV